MAPSIARREENLGNLGPKSVLGSMLRRPFFGKKGLPFHQITAHFYLQYPLSANIIALFCPSRHSVLGRGVIINIMEL